MKLKILTLMSVALTGCISSIVPDAKSLPPRYTIDAPEAAAVPGAPIDAALAISDARSEAAFNTSRIAVMTNPNEIRYLPNAEWSDRGPRMVSLLQERSFEALGRLKAVSDRVALPVADYIFYSDISAFHVDRSVKPHVARVEFRARVETTRGNILGAQRFVQTQTLANDTTREAAVAIGDAAAAASSQAAGWAVGLIEANEVKRSGV
ncbi:MAG: ABC-type transport auxiliary lipoprotein family protein [Pseudomonadota bacterium]